MTSTLRVRGCIIRSALLDQEMRRFGQLEKSLIDKRGLSRARPIRRMSHRLNLLRSWVGSGGRGRTRRLRGSPGAKSTHAPRGRSEWECSGFRDPPKIYTGLLGWAARSLVCCGWGLQLVQPWNTHSSFQSAICKWLKISRFLYVLKCLKQRWEIGPNFIASSPVCHKLQIEFL